MDMVSKSSWENQAECGKVDPDIFFPEGKVTLVTMELDRLAKKVCDSCLVQIACLAYALENETYGTWGGYTADERRKLKQKRFTLGRL